MSDPAWAGSERAAQLLAWASAYAVALWFYRASTRSGEQRFILALWAGVVFAHLGWGLLNLPQVLEEPHRLFHPGAVSVLFVPLGVLVVAPWREALAALPLALAVSRLGCLAYACCYAAPSDAIAELGGLLLLHFYACRWPEHTAPIVLSGFGLVRLVSTPLRVEPHAGLFIDPMWIAGLWVVAGVALRGRIGSADQASEWLTQRTQPLVRSLLLVAVVWALFPIAASLPMNRSMATLLACVAATAAVLVLRSWASPSGASSAAGVLALGIAAGILVSGMTAYGLGFLGNTPSATLGVDRFENGGDAVRFASIVLLAPVFQEILYRERLLGQLRDLCGGAWAVVLSSALFAVSHLALDTMAIAFAGGIVAGVVMLRTRSLPLVIGMHAGWNAGVLMRVGAMGMVAAAIGGCASEHSEARPSRAGANRTANESDNYLRFVAFELPFGDAVLLRWSERQMPLRIFLPPPPEGLFSNPDAYRNAVREGVLSWTEVAGPGLPRFEFVDEVGDAHIPVAWASEPQGDWYIAQTIFNVVPSQRRFDVAQLLVTARWRDGRIAGPEDVRRVVLHEMGHALGFAGHSPDPADVMNAAPSVNELSDRDRATLAALYARSVGARVTGARGSRLR